MNDIICIGIFVACLIATIGLVRLCEGLMPRVKGDTDKSGGGS